VVYGNGVSSSWWSYWKKLNFFVPSVSGGLRASCCGEPRGTSADRYKVQRRTYVDGHCSLGRLMYDFALHSVHIYHFPTVLFLFDIFMSYLHFRLLLIECIHYFFYHILICYSCFWIFYPCGDYNYKKWQ